MLNAEAIMEGRGFHIIMLSTEPIENMPAETIYEAVLTSSYLAMALAMFPLSVI